MKKRVTIVYNSRSGRGATRRAGDHLRALLPKNGFDTTMLNVRRSKLDAQVTNGSTDLIVVIGGDGTLRSAIQHLVDKKINLPIALLPRGSANVVAKSLGLSRSVEALAQSIQHDARTHVDVAQLSTGQCFIGAFAMGYLSERVTATPRHFKQRLGFSGYVLSFLRNRKIPEHEYRVTVDGRAQTHRGHSLFIVNTANLFGFRSRRFTSLHDGIYELVIPTNRTFFGLIGLLVDFYFRVSHPRHFVFASGRTFSVTADSAVSRQIDGERLPNSAEASLTVLSRKQAFIVPR